VLISRKEKENLVIHLAYEGKTTREIAKQAHISLRDIGSIIRKVTEGDDAFIEKEKEKKDAEGKAKTVKESVTICPIFSNVQRQETT
jgi:transposase